MKAMDHGPDHGPSIMIDGIWLMEHNTNKLIESSTTLVRRVLTAAEKLDVSTTVEGVGLLREATEQRLWSTSAMCTTTSTDGLAGKQASE